MAIKHLNLVRVTTATTGTGTIALGTAVASFLTFAAAGAADGDKIGYAIEDGSNREIGWGVYTASGATLTRNVYASTNSGNPISLSGAAQVVSTVSAENLLAGIHNVGKPAATPAAGTVQLYALYNPVPTMTANNAPSGYVVSASTAYVTAPAWGAFQQNAHGAYSGVGVGWITNASATGYLQVQLPTGVSIRGYEITPLAEFPARTPKTWTVQGSTDGSSWTTLDTQTNVTTGWQAGYKGQGAASEQMSIPRTFMLSAVSASYTYFKIDITANNGDTYTAIAQFRLLSDTPNNFGPPSLFLVDANAIAAKVMLMNQYSTWV